MARFLLTVWPFETHLYPNLALAHALRESGHSVAFYTGVRARPEVEGAGFPCFPLRHVDEVRIGRVVDSILADRKHPRRLQKAWREFLVDSIPGQLQDLETVLREWPPDVIVCDMALWGPILVLAEVQRIPVAVFSHVGYCVLRGRDGPTPGISLPRPRHVGLRLAAWVVDAVASLATADLRRRADRLRRRHGLRPLGMKVTEFYGEMPLFLIPSAPEFDYQRRDLPPSVRYVGPCLWPDPGQAPVPERRGGAIPRVVVDEGSLHAPETTLLQAVVAGLAGLPMQVLVIAGKGRDIASLNLGPLPDNIRIQPWQPLASWVDLADLVVTNGNTESALGALSRGLPLVVVPAILDQSEIAWRVVESGAGVRLSERRCTPERLRAAVQRVLVDPACRSHARQLAAVLTRYRGAREAATLLVNLAGAQALA